MAAPAIQPAQAMHLSEKVELFVASGDLTYTNTFCVLYMKRGPQKEFESIGQTEAIGGNQNPTRWTKRFYVDYFFEEEQVLRFDVYTEQNYGKKTGELKDHKLVGTATCALGEILSSDGSILQRRLMVKGYPIKNRKTKRMAHVIAFAAKCKLVQETRQVSIAFAANKLIQADKTTLSDPYFLITRNQTVVYGDRTQHIKNTIFPKWPTFTIDTQHLCNNDPNAELTIEIWDWDADDKSGDDFLGSVTLTLNDLKTRPQGIEIVNDRKRAKKRGFGTFDVRTYKSASTFIDYLQGGVNMSLMVALDFTASNKHPSDASSLHCIQDPQSGQAVVSAYQQGIRVIGNIVSVYDADQLYPVWAFGLNVPSLGGNALHAFNLNFDDANADVPGIHGIEQCYVNAVNAIQSTTIIPSGPTFCTPVLERAEALAKDAHAQYMAAVAQVPHTPPQYFILLILTDGVIDDMKQTKDALVRIANTNVPLSVIIVGVGDEDFSAMRVLDADDVALTDSGGSAAYRDIVQFVPFNEVAATHDMSMLAKETLREIPAQFMSYVDAFNIEPLSQGKPKYTASEYQSKKGDNEEEDEKELAPNVDYNIKTDPWLSAPVPPGWSRQFTDDGKPFYVNETAEKTQWEHPAAVQFLKRLNEKQEAQNANSLQTKTNTAFENFGDDNWAMFD